MKETKISEEVREKIKIKIQMKNREAKNPRKSKNLILRARVNQKEKIKKTPQLPKNQNANSNDFYSKHQHLALDPYLNLKLVWTNI
jgi:hypothetical protein